MNAIVEKAIEDAAKNEDGNEGRTGLKTLLEGCLSGTVDRVVAEIPENAEPEPDQPDGVRNVQFEARIRLAQILSSLPMDLRPYVQFELQEIQNGRLPEGEASILKVDELEMVLYAEKLPKADIRLIIAGIRHRAREAQKRTEEKIRNSGRRPLESRIVG